MYPILIDINGFQITTYGLMVAIAFATLWLCVVSRGQKLGYSQEFLQNLITLNVIAAFVFARLLYIITVWDEFTHNPWSIIFSRDGYVFYGGFIGAILILIWYTRRRKLSVAGILDLFAPFVALAQGIGRIGCFLFGCCYGAECHLPWAVQFPDGSPASYHFGVDHWVHPSQIYHSLFNFIHFGILIAIRKRQTFRGQIAASYFMIYSVGRFLIEFTRGDYRGFLGPFSTSQIISFLIFTGGLIFYIQLRRAALSPETIQDPAPAEAE